MPETHEMCIAETEFLSMHEGLSDFQTRKSFRWEVLKNLQSLYQSDRHSLELLRT